MVNMPERYEVASHPSSVLGSRVLTSAAAVRLLLNDLSHASPRSGWCRTRAVAVLSRAMSAELPRPCCIEGRAKAQPIADLRCDSNASPVSGPL